MIKKNAGLLTKAAKIFLPYFTLIFVMISSHSAIAQQNSQEDSLMIRIAEIEIDLAYLDDYKAILAEEAAASVKLEPGVLVIFPMYQKQNPAQIRLLEIYASQEAYEQHIKSPHFQKYKTTTLDMVRSLKLIDMDAIDSTTMPLLFRKLKKDQ